MAVQNNETPEAQNGSGEEPAHPKAESFLALTLGSVGVVYGDIGTSPLYALREALLHIDEGGVTRDEVLGVVSLLLWALIVTVTIKYVVVLLHADNRGEGGTLSLMALAQSAVGKRTTAVFLLGVIGAALFYGDAIITPAISVLSAVEGLKLVTPVLEPYVIGITLVILVALFAVQRHGTGVMAAWFGPITAVWFIAMGLLGIWHLGDDPGILAAFDPRYALSFMAHHGVLGFVVLGSVFLAVTGAEALYADMGHFGRGPIQAAWMLFVFPALALNYLGQGAFILARPEAIENPFYLMAPDFLLLPLVLLATAATIIASQAVITGAFSITRQAIQLGLLPRLAINHTSESQAGQIYMPSVNMALLVGVLVLVVLFKSSGALASAYGISVTGTMVVTTALAFVVVWRCWRWPLPLAALFIAPFLVIDVTFLGANLLKVLDGGYVPLLLAAGVVLVMWTWSRGTALVRAKTQADSVPLVDLVRSLERKPPHRIPNTAMFLTGDPEVAPAALLHNLKHNMVLHDRNVILTVQTAPVPRVAPEGRVQISPISEGFTKVVLTFGFMESPNVPKALAICRKLGMKFDIMRTSFFLGRTSVRPSATSGMPLWQDKLFIGLTRLATNATEFFAIPPGRVVEVGTQVTV